MSQIGLLFSQEVEQPVLQRQEISTDLSGALLSNFRVDYSRRGKKKGALVIGLRMRSELRGVTLDTSRMARSGDRTKFIPSGMRALDLSVGVKSFLGKQQPQQGLWVQLTALTSLVQRNSNAYKTAIAESFFPDEVREPKQMFGIEGDVGYRYVFGNGLSLNAFVSWTTLLLRSEVITDRFPQNQRESGGFDSALSGSFLTLGYVW